MILYRLLKSTGRDRSWTGDYAAMWTLPSCARRVIRARSLLTPDSRREYPARTSLVSPLQTGVVSRHVRATLKSLRRRLSLKQDYVPKSLVPNA